MFKCLSSLSRYGPIAMIGLGLGLLVGVCVEGIPLIIIGIVWGKRWVK